MLLGYYDLQGYGNLVPGGDAELSTWGTGGSPLLHAAIASQGHIDDFYGGLSPSGGYLNSGDDTYSGRAFDCLADFMGTSQDAYGNVNGSTTFWNYTSGNALTYTSMAGSGNADDSGMYGIYEYIAYADYGVDSLYNQWTYEYAVTRGVTTGAGFSLDDYMAEIDAGQPVLIHVTGHTMLGYGYDEADNSIIYLRNTWNSGIETMIWGGSYEGMDMRSVTVLDLAAVPEPISLVMLGCLGTGMFAARRARRKKDN